jgi:dimethylhistidine N-methyltransferase
MIENFLTDDENLLSDEETEPISLPAVPAEIRPFFEEVLRGLRQPNKSLPCKYFYDERGSQLFDRICELGEYYLTRTEVAIMREHVGEMAELIGPGCVLIEYGSGSSTKTRFLLDRLRDPRAYLPIDISRDHLLHSVEGLRRAYPGLNVVPVCADYTADFTLPIPRGEGGRRVVYFPGSTLGNFEPGEALQFLKQIARVCGRGGGLLIGVDLEKDERVLEPAYNDREGVTAEFNLNVLRHINRELGVDFELDGFRHHAFYNRRESRIEMHLVSRRPQTVCLCGTPILFAEGENICTEYSYKYTLEKFAAMAGQAGLSVEQVWTDPRNWFSVQYLRVKETYPGD